MKRRLTALWFDVRLFLHLVGRRNPYADKAERFSPWHAWEIARAGRTRRRDA